MKTIRLGQTALQVPAMALGIMRMNALTPQAAAQTLKTAVKAGISYIDSADVYGGGKSEKVFRQAMQLANIQREQLFIQSKGGIIPASDFSKSWYDFSKQHLIETVDGILQRFGIDYLDSFLLHRPDPLMEPSEVAAAFDELQRTGKVRYFGVSNFNPQQIALLQADLSQKLLIDQLQFSIMHTGMIDAGMHVNMEDTRSLDHDGGILDYARLNHLTIQAWSPFQYGVIAGTFIDNPKFERLNQVLAYLGQKYQVSKNAIAAAWILRHPANIQVILGTMNPQHIIDSAAGAEIILSRQEWYQIYFAAGNDLP
ncbi:aldo/keto reductase [Liquorilactobacillus sicerae]|uniref:aldo/keto reductase n=1 Tax=Liquorilactobacillus sicerae TaxID=1416943 RepID=UPI002480057B|nr:aldo/keto reductase [Liquorilactobacillus sicerae]